MVFPVRRVFSSQKSAACGGASNATVRPGRGRSFERGAEARTGQRWVRGIPRAPVRRDARCVDGDAGTATRSSAVLAALSRGRASKALSQVREREKDDVWPRDRGAACPRVRRVVAERADPERPGDPVSMRGMTCHDLPFEARARPSAAALARCARGTDMVTRGGGCARTSVKKRDGRRLSFADPSSGRKGTCRCETSGARATGLTRVRRQELWRAGGRLLWRRRLMSLVARSEEGPLKFDIWTVGAAFFPRNRRLGLKDRGL